MFYVSANEEIEFFAIERGCMIDLRAKKLVEIRLFPMALNFTRHALRAIRACTYSLALQQNISERQILVMMEIYYALLFEGRKSDSLNSELKALNLDLADRFIQHLFASLKDYSKLDSVSKTSNKSTNKSNEKRLWIHKIYKPYKRMSQYSLQFILKRILNDGYADCNILNDLLSIWINEYKKCDDFELKFRILVQASKTNSLIYDCCELFYRLVSVICISIEHSNKTIYIDWKMFFIFIYSYRTKVKLH